MKILRLVLFCAGLACSLRAVDTAPDTVAGKVFLFEVTEGTGELATSGGGYRVFNGNGTFFSLGVSGSIDSAETGTYTYAKLSADTGKVVFKTPSRAYAVTSTFESETSGTFSAATLGDAAGEASGHFAVGPFSTTPPLVNISTRLTLAPNGVAIAGFVVGGALPRQVLIRAVGPTLGEFGVKAPLADPQLTVYDVRGKPIASNDNWTGLEAIFDRVGASAFPVGSKDAAIVLTLKPGAYTVHVSSTVPGQTGEALAEVYFIE